MRKILAISSSRADIGIQAHVWRSLVERSDVELHLLLTGMHCRDGMPDMAALLPTGRVEAHFGGADLGGREVKVGQSSLATAAMGRITEYSGEIASKVGPDIAIATGDRLDMLPAVMGLMSENCPILHLHGGEVTQGAIDDRVRHALTKLSHLHAVSTNQAADRIRRMGEEAWRIHVTGAPGLDSLRAQPEISDEEFGQAVGLANLDGLRLITVHPETESAEPEGPARTLFEALQQCADAPTIITGTNSDPNADKVDIQIKRYLENAPNVVFRETLGGKLYANAMRKAAVMLGNSSSGIIEAALFDCPVINIGNRQRGREAPDNVTTVPASSEDILSALKNLASRIPVASIYGDGHAAPRIAEIAAKHYDRTRLLSKHLD